MEEQNPKIKTFYVWQNGMVMVFDQDGQQMSELQGPWKEKKEQILKAVEEANGEVVAFFNAVWGVRG